MSVREIFEQKYSATVETCADDVLEIFDYLLEKCDELEEVRDTQRKRITALEQENNALRAFLAETEGVERSADDIEEVISAVDSTLAKLDSLISLRESLLDISASCKDIYASAEQLSRSRAECENTLSGEAAALQCSDDNSDSEKLDTEPEEAGTEEVTEENSVQDSDDAGEIANRLKSMLESDDGSENVKSTKNAADADDGFSDMIIKFFSDADTKSDAEKKELTLAEPVMVIDGEDGDRDFFDAKLDVPQSDPEPSDTRPAFASRKQVIANTEAEARAVAAKATEKVIAADSAKPAEAIGAVPVDVPSTNASEKKSELQSIRDSLAKIKSKRNGK